MRWWGGEQEAAGAKGGSASRRALREEAPQQVKIKTYSRRRTGSSPEFKAAAAAKKGPDMHYFWGRVVAGRRLEPGDTEPMSTTSPKAELAHYLNTKRAHDGKVWTAPWYVQRVPPCLPQREMSLAVCEGAATWSELLTACDQLNAKGITPIAGGIKDG